MSRLPRSGARLRVIVLGGGFGGAYAAHGLSRILPRGWETLVVDRNNFLLFYPLLMEAAVGSLEARHVVVPIRKFMKCGELLMAEVQSVDLHDQVVTALVEGAETPQRLHYDHLVLAIGSVTRFQDIAGLREHAFQIKSLEDGLALRDRGIRLLELANTERDPDRRRAILRVVVVGANFTGTEFAGEYQDFLRDATQAYDRVSPDDVRVSLFEYSDRILGALDPSLAAYASDHLKARGLDVRVKTSVTEVGEHHVVATDGERIDCYTTVWAAGIAPNPLVAHIPGLPLNQQGYVDCEPDFRVKGFANVWAIGDMATIIAPDGKPYPATAQNATREGSLCARNVLAAIEDRSTQPFRFNALGSLAALGRRTAVAKVFGIRLTGFIAWFAYRTVYLLKMPSWSRRFRIILDWTTDLFFRREPVQLGVHDVERAPSRDAERNPTVR